MHKDKDKVDAGFLAGLAGAIAAGGSMPYRPGINYRVCGVCLKPIVGGQGYVKKIHGTIHTACDEDRKSSEKEKGKDAEQGQENAAGNRGSVCPEG